MNVFEKLTDFVKHHPSAIGKIVDFDLQTDQLLALDFTSANKELNSHLVADTDLFANWVKKKLNSSKSKYGIGGYNEHRTIYSRSEHFDSIEEPRRLHLGTDIWGPALTPIYNFMDGEVHSFNYNHNYGDYGATIIIQYQLDNVIFYALYGHLSLMSIQNLTKGELIAKGQHFASFGVKEENGNWPPHLHFQLIVDMQDYTGDYPGVCQFSKRSFYLQNSPDPAIILEKTFSSALPKL